MGEKTKKIKIVSRIVLTILILILINSKFMAYAEDINVKNPTKAALRSLALPGWGQFYNGKYLKGKIILGTEVTFISGMITTYILFDKEYDKYKENKPETVKYYDKAHDYYKINNYLFWTSIGGWLYSVIDAYFDNPADIKKIKPQQSSKERKFEYQIYIERGALYPQICLAIETSF